MRRAYDERDGWPQVSTTEFVWMLIQAIGLVVGAFIVILVLSLDGIH